MKPARNGRPIEILLIEDDPGDVELTMEVLEMAKVKVNISTVEDGIQALEYLRNEGKFSDASRPDLILLDLNMPRMDGRETLEEIKKDVSLKLIPVVILTTSDSDEDVVKTYTLGASCYITKPVGLEQFSKVVHSIENFWFTVVNLPPND
jgi:two-component system, chemotaxis family, response regulator Rcp1